MNKIFPGKTAVYVSCPYSEEHSCKKAKKSNARFSRKIGNQPTDGPTTFWGLGSTEVENCNLLAQLSQLQGLLRLL